MKAYLVLDLTVNDLAGFRKYVAEIPAHIAKHSGRYIVQGVVPTPIEGDWKPERLVILEFPDRTNAEKFSAILTSRTCSRRATAPRRAGSCLPKAVPDRPRRYFSCNVRTGSQSASGADAANSLGAITEKSCRSVGIG